MILPTRSFFDAPKGRDHAVALEVFAQIKAHMGLGDDWPVRLEPQEAAPRPMALGDTVLVQTDVAPVLGTFRVDETGPLIAYDPDLPTTPRAFIATMAHELARYMMLAIPDPQATAADPDLDEIATDIMVIAAGFGVMSLETAFSAESFGDTFAQGWQVSRRGYISPEVSAFALGLFLSRHSIPLDDLRAHLAPANVKRLKRALAQIDADPALVDPDATEH
ncbi:MAG: hypothetical protein KDK53_08425 [Maritimibacter sp.]|nr:hypothetical protein [Maritimibacter sp.]